MLWSKIKKFFKTSHTNPLSETQEKQTLRLLLFAEIICIITDGFSIWLAYNRHQPRIFIATVIIFILFIIITLITYITKNRHLSTAILLTIFYVIFTIAFIFRVEAGFWQVFIPHPVMYILGYAYGFWLGFMFMITNYILVYVPRFREILLQYYEPIYLSRYIIIYNTGYILSSIIMYQYHLTKLRQNKNEAILEEAVRNEHNKVSSIMMQTILSIGNAVEAKDLYTGKHSQRVSYFSCLIAEKLGWKKDEIKNLQTIAQLHDIGKIGVDSKILNKPARLTDDEFYMMKQHTTIGYEILKDLNLVPNVDSGAAYHHERYDGKGYPKGLSGNDIPIEARIICIADSFDAMNYSRIYRNKCDQNYIRGELEKGKGTQFDPELIDIFLKLCEEHNWFADEEALIVK